MLVFTCFSSMLTSATSASVLFLCLLHRCFALSSYHIFVNSVKDNGTKEVFEFDSGFIAGPVVTTGAGAQASSQVQFTKILPNDAVLLWRLSLFGFSEQISLGSFSFVVPPNTLKVQYSSISRD